MLWDCGPSVVVMVLRILMKPLLKIIAKRSGEFYISPEHCALFPTPGAQAERYPMRTLDDLFHDRDGGLGRVRIRRATSLDQVACIFAKMREGQQ